MNEVRLEGTVIKSSLDPRGFLVVTLAVMHDHWVDGNNIPSRSFIVGMLPDKKRSENIALFKNERIAISGYLRDDVWMAGFGGQKERRKMRLYITEIHTI